MCALRGLAYRSIMRAICRVAKIKGAGSISGKSEHNYRQGHVPNADPERKHLNHEYVLNYETLGKAIEGRIKNAGVQRVRQDAVKGMEFILTASPEHFPRDQDGQVTQDCRKSEWLQANLDFLKQRYGPNLVAFTLHQDEKTPHIHAIVVPITTDNRLCAKQLFSPKTLRQLQTDYAKAMKPFGLERGVEGSRAKHVEMKHIYGLQQQERQAIERELKSLQAPTPPLRIEPPGMLDLLNLERWRKEQETKINAEHNRQLAQVKEAAQKAQKAAVANATAKEQGKVLQQRLETSEALKQANHEKAQNVEQRLDVAKDTLEQIAVLMDEKRLGPEWSRQNAERVRKRSLPQIEKVVSESLKGIANRTQLIERLTKSGYEVKLDKDNQTYVTDPKTEVRLDLLNHKIGKDSLGDMIRSSIEQTLKQQQEEALKPKVKKSLGREI